MDSIGGIEARERTREFVLRFLVDGIDEVLVLLSVWLRASSSSNSWVLEFLRSGGLFAAIMTVAVAVAVVERKWNEEEDGVKGWCIGDWRLVIVRWENCHERLVWKVGGGGFRAKKIVWAWDVKDKSIWKRWIW